ncbi:MAG: TolC family protein [bacterium]
MKPTFRSGYFVHVLLVSGLCLGTGCATLRHAREVQNGEHTVPGERRLTAREAGLSSNTLLTIDRALAISLAYHPSIFQAQQALEAATAQVYQARAAYWPQLSASAGETRSTANTAGTPESHHAANSFSGSLGLNLLVYDFGKTPAQVRQAYARQLAAAEALRSARSDLAYSVRTAFYTLGKSLELSQVSADAVRQYRDHLAQVESFREVGRRTRYDQTKSEVDLGNAQLNLIRAQSDVSDARAALNRQLGLTEEPGYTTRPDDPAAFPAASAETLMETARKHHPGLRRLQIEEQVASAAVDEAIASLYPEIGLQARYGLSGGHFPLVWNWSALLQSSVQLFTGRRQTWAITEAVTRLRSARSKVADREQQIFEDLKNAVNQLISSRQRLSLTELLVRQAQESLDLVNERYRIGTATAVEVTDAQVALTGARAEQVKAKFDYQAAVAQIKHAVGEE